MAQSRGVEHSIHMPAHGIGHGEVAPLERQLNCFVRSVALIERVGNAFGTLAFTWATVVLLGGYATYLRGCDDFWFATAIFFLETTRTFSSRNNRMDYQLFFGTRGAFKPLGLNGLILVINLSGMVCMIFRKFLGSTIIGALPFVGMLVAIGQFACPCVPRLLARSSLGLVISLWSPMVAIILLGTYIVEKSMGTLTLYAVLLVLVLLVTISKMRFPCIIKLVASALGRKKEFWCRIVLTLCMICAIGIVSFSLPSNRDVFDRLLRMLFEVSTLVLISFGNLQIPAAIVRVVLPLIRLIKEDYNDPCNGGNHGIGTPNLQPSLSIFYGMVLGQGVLYFVACMLEIFSFIPRRSLVHRAGFKGRWGVDAVNLYYTYALEKSMQGDMLARKDISLCNFAIDSVNSNSTKRQLHGIRITHILLQKDATRTHLLVKLNASIETMTRLLRMLDWTGQGHETIRLFAVKIINDLAKGLLIVTLPGIVQKVSLLLDCGYQQKRGNPLLCVDDEQDKQQNDLPVNIKDNQMESGDAAPDTHDLLETDDRSTQQAGNREHNSWIVRWWQHVCEFWSIPQEEPLREQDLLPVLGMSIIESLATYDESNCEEISKATGLIQKVTRFTRFWTSDTKYTDAERIVLVHSSLKLFHRLTSIDGEIGIILRQKISNHPFLLRNLSEILGDITSCHELRILVAGILRNLAIDVNMRHAIGRVRRIITRLMQAFLAPEGTSGTDADRLLRKVAGQALAMLAMDNVNNCLAMLREPGYSFIKELTDMIHIVRYKCVAASLLRSVCMHTRAELKEDDLEALSYSSREVLERILRAQGAELEIFIGLSSHIYKAIPEEFAREFEYGQIKETFVKRLIDALHANMEPNADCPGIRRVILEQAVNLMEFDSRNVKCFQEHRMMEALLVVEETVSKAEDYSFFLGDVGLLKAGEPLSSLVARAKQLLAVR